jgi:large subunit ribosomal protein L6
MSRIGKQPVLIPDGVTVDIKDGVAFVRGKAGALEVPIPGVVEMKMEGNTVTIAPKKETKQTPAMWGLTRSLLANAVEGLTEGYTKKLEIHGVGYRANLQGDTLVLALGYSHDVTLKAPEGITFAVEKNEITVSGHDKELVGNVAAKIRAFRKPEPYKGKGIRYAGEVVRRKAGKKAAA